MDQSMLEEEFDDTWMFLGSSDKDEDEDGLSGESVVPFMFIYKQILLILKKYSILI